MLAVVTVGACGSALIDIRTRRVPNALTLAVGAMGVLFAAGGIGKVGLAASLGGFALGLLLMLPGHLFGGTGAGDVKLFAAIGTLLGPSAVMEAFIYTALAGGAIGLIVAVKRRRLRRTVENAAKLLMGEGNAEIEHPLTPNRFAYAPAIAIGTVLAALRM